MVRHWKIRSDECRHGVSSGKPEGVHPVVAELLALRDIVSPDDRRRFLEPDYDQDLHDPFLFSAMDAVMGRLKESRENGERIGIFGDFDADGLSSSVLLREGISKLGLDLSVYIPDKHAEGHGLSPLAVDFFEEKGVALIFTVDCGMMNHEEIAEAKRRGMDTIIVDHHHVPETLPPAYAIINPKLPGEPYPFKDLCGAGATFKVLQAIYKTFFPDEVEQLKWFLDVAAVGTVADVMPLVGENRVIVAYGLIVLSKTRRTGFQEMLALGRMPLRSGKVPVARDIAFHIAPRINAASRMAHARVVHDLLMEPDAVKAREFARLLEGYNDERRKVSEAISKLVREEALRSSDRKIVFAVHEDFHFGVVGLVAGRIANEFHKPTVVLTKGEEISRGSLRSIPELHITEALESCSDLLERFGGHAAAAGLTVRNDKIPEFEARLEAIVAEKLSGVRTEPEIVVDMRLRPEHLTLDLVRELRRFAPFGEGNPEPAFLLEGMIVEEIRPVGSDGKHLKFILRSGGRAFDAIGFSLAGEFSDLEPGSRVDVLFSVDENEWNGSVGLQLKIADLRRG